MALEALLTAIVRVDDVAAFCRGTLGSQVSLSIKDIDGSLAATQEIQRLVVSECSPYEGDLLIYDTQRGQQIANKLRDPLGKILKQRGLQLMEIFHFELQRGKASEQIKGRLEEWEDIIKATESAESVEDVLRDIEKRGILKDSDFEQFKEAVEEAGDNKEAARAHLRSLAELQRQYEKQRLEVLLKGDLNYRQQIEDSLAAAGKREEELADALQRAKVSGVEKEIQSLEDEHELALSRKRKALELWELEEKSRIEMDKKEREMELELRQKREELETQWTKSQQEGRRKEMEKSERVTQYCAYCNRPIPPAQTYFYCLKCGKGPLCNNDYFGDKGCAFCSKRGK
jgi:chromosome segregation ATPase